jgi:hypothetical protein
LLNPTVRYSAQRSLMSGVTQGTTVTLVLPIRWAGMTRSRRPFVHTRRSLGGIRETYRYNSESTYALSTLPLPPSQALNMKQFLDSVEDGQVFEFDPDGLGVWIDVVIASEGYDEPREAARDTLVSYSFSVVETVAAS